MIKTFMFSIWLLSHPVHVSLLSIDYAPESDSFRVFLKVYFDDFLIDSGINRSGETISFSEDGTNGKGRLLIYITAKLQLKVNGKLVEGEIENVDLSGGELKTSLNYKVPGRIRTVEVSNSIMKDLYPDQSNMVIIKVNGFEEGFRLTPEDTVRSFRIN